LPQGNQENNYRHAFFIDLFDIKMQIDLDILLHWIEDEKTRQSGYFAGMCVTIAGHSCTLKMDNPLDATVRKFAPLGANQNAIMLQ
jgi:hypothetical protein